MDIVHVVHMAMGDVNKIMQPVNLTSAATEKFSFVIKVGSHDDRIEYKVTFA